MNQSEYTRGTSSSVNVLLSLQLVGIQNQNLKQKLIQQIEYTVKRRRKLLYSLEDLEKLYLFKDYLLLILKIMHPKYPCYIHSNGTKLEVTETCPKYNPTPLTLELGLASFGLKNHFSSRSHKQKLWILTH